MTVHVDGLPTPRPVGLGGLWKVRRNFHGWLCTHPNGITVLSSYDRQSDGKRWHHVSVSRPDRAPTWDDLHYAKLRFMGTDTRALQIIPPEAEYVNLHPYCFHLWVCLDGDVTPDFRDRGMI